MNKFYGDIVAKRDRLLKDAFAKHGFNPDDVEFIKAHISALRQEGDRFEHIYYNLGKADQLRILSWEHSPEIKNGWNDLNSYRDSFKITYEFHYY